MKLHSQARIRQALLGLFLADPRRQWCGIDMWRAIGCTVGGLYVALARLETAGWITSDFEDGPSPRRRCYWPTEDYGVEKMRLELLNANWHRKDEKAGT